MIVKNGFNLWKRLVFEIKPNLIILSTRKSYLDSLNPRLKQVLYTVYKTKDGKPRRPFNLEHHQINILGLDIDLVYGEPKNLPFGSVSTEDKIKMGEIIEETRAVVPRILRQLLGARKATRKKIFDIRFSRFMQDKNKFICYFAK